MFYILYLLLSSGLLFALSDPYLLAVLSGLQVLLWTGSKVPLRRTLALFRRVGLFLILVFLAYAFVPTPSGEDRWISVGLWLFSLEVNLSGLWLGLLMNARILILVMASIWVQHAAAPKTLRNGLVRCGIPRHVAIALDHTLALFSGADGRQRGKSRKIADGTNPGPRMRTLLKGDVSPIRHLMDSAFECAGHRLAQHEPDLDPQTRNDIAVIVGMTLAMLSFRMIVFVPGLLVAPGHKNVVLIPLFLIAAQRTQGRSGGLHTGLCMGLVGFMLGFGKLGILELIQFVLTGFLADVLLSLYRSVGLIAGTLQLMLIGAVMGLARFSTNLMLLFLAGAPVLGFAILAPVLVAQVLFGALSGLPARILLRAPASTR